MIKSLTPAQSKIFRSCSSVHAVVIFLRHKVNVLLASNRSVPLSAGSSPGIRLIVALRMRRRLSDLT